VPDSYMSKTITIDDDAYALLAGLKQGAHDSFTKVIRRHVYRPAETCGELLDAMENQPSPKVDLDLLDQIAKDRGRPSGGHGILTGS
jgi:predicted CopG family antitoxin